MSKAKTPPEPPAKPSRTAQDRPKPEKRGEHQEGPKNAPERSAETMPATRWASRIVSEADVRPTVLIPNPQNFRKHPKSQQTVMTGALDEIGWIQRVIVNKRTGHIIDGHLRVEMALEMHEATVPVCYVDLSEDEERIALATFDPISALSNVDEDIHAALLKSIECDNADLAGLLAYGDTPTVGLRTDENAVPEPPKNAITRVGDIITLGAHRLMCGDSTSADDVARLMRGEKASMVFTDPPYGVSFRSNMSKRFEVLKNDDRILEVAPVIYGVMEEDSAAIVWTAQQVYPQWRSQFAELYKSTIIWAKGGGGMGDLTGDFAPNYEMALFCVKGRPSFYAPRPGAVWEIGKDAAADYVHPTQKPVALAEHGLNLLCPPAGRVLDLFGGSGSTLIACEKTRRIAYLMELDPIYCDVIVARWEQATGKKAIRTKAKVK